MTIWEIFLCDPQIINYVNLIDQKKRKIIKKIKLNREKQKSEREEESSYNQYRRVSIVNVYKFWRE